MCLQGDPTYFAQVGGHGCFLVVAWEEGLGSREKLIFRDRDKHDRHGWFSDTLFPVADLEHMVFERYEFSKPSHETFRGLGHWLQLQEAPFLRLLVGFIKWVQNLSAYFQEYGIPNEVRIGFHFCQIKAYLTWGSFSYLFWGRIFLSSTFWMDALLLPSKDVPVDTINLGEIEHNKHISELTGC